MEPDIHVSWTAVVSSFVTGILVVLGWAIRTIGQQHIATIKEMSETLKSLNAQVEGLNQRITTIEATQQFIIKKD